MYKAVLAYYVKVDVRSGEVFNSRFTHGLYVKYGCVFAGEEKNSHKTSVLADTLKPTWNDSRVVTIAKVTDETIEAFETDSVTFTVFAVQKEGAGGVQKVTL